MTPTAISSGVDPRRCRGRSGCPAIPGTMNSARIAGLAVDSMPGDYAVSRSRRYRLMSMTRPFLRIFLLRDRSGLKFFAVA